MRKRRGRTIASLCVRPYCHIFGIALQGLSLPAMGMGDLKAEILLVRVGNEELARSAVGRGGEVGTVGSAGEDDEPLLCSRSYARDQP